MVAIQDPPVGYSLPADYSNAPTVGPNARPAQKMKPDERMTEVVRLLALGLLRNCRNSSGRK